MDNASNFKIESFKSLIEKDLPPRPCWLDPGIIPKNSLTILGSTSKAGKSFVMLELARALALGVSPFGYTQLQVSEPAKVLLIEQELGEYGLQKRIKIIFEKEDPRVYGDNLWYVSKVPTLQLDSHEGRELLFDIVDKVKPNILMLDPIGRFHCYDENRSDQIQELVSSLDYLNKCFSSDQMAIILSHHTGKPGTDPKTSRDLLDPYSLRGSSKFFDAPDTLIMMQKLERLDTKWKAWNIRMRIETRQDENPPDLLLTFNKEQDLRVRFKAALTDRPAEKDRKKKEKERPAEQLMFNES